MDARIIEPVPTPEEQEKVITAQDVNNALTELTSILGVTDESDQDTINQFIRLLSLDDDKFELLAPGVLQNYMQQVNDPNQKLALAQSLNANGGKIEDLADALIKIREEVEELPFSVAKQAFILEIIASLMNSIMETEGISKRTLNIAIELCDERAKIPQYAHISDSGMDVFALEDITINPGETKLVPTGFKIALPPGYELQVRPKSGRSLKSKLRIANAPGTIDQGYRDEVGIIVENIEAPIKDITIDEDGKVTSILYGSSHTIGAGEKFCQLVLAETPKVAWFEVGKVMDTGEDRGGGFGSTGLT